MARKRILVVDDEPSIRRVLEKHLEERGYEVRSAQNGAEGREAGDAWCPDIVILDIRLPDTDGLELLQEFREKRPALLVIIITAFGDMHTTIAAMQRGAFDYLRKPIDVDELDEKVDLCARTIDERTGPGLVVTEAGADRDIYRVIGNSRKLQEIFKIIGSVSSSRTTVLIQGESGTGKELIARAIHFSSVSRQSPFIAINCGALVETLLASELFGHERGAFTGAVARKRGKFELAGDGTIFLDEIAEMTVGNQVKLLRVLQERRFERVGGNETLTTNARIIAATIPPLEECVARGRFREDLFYRLKVVTIHVPPLRERPEDIPVLVEHFVAQINRELQKNVRRIPDETMQMLVQREWRGNIRELENALRQALVNCKGDTLLRSFLPPGERPKSGDPLPVDSPPALTDLRTVEEDHIRRVLRHTKWNKLHASRILNISRPTLDRKIREYGLQPPDDPVA